MRMKKATAFGLAALMAATMIPAVPAMAKGDDSEGSVYYLNFKPEQADQWSDLAKKYTDETGVPVTVVTAASGTYESTLKSEMAKDEVPTLFQVNGPVGLASWKDYCYDLKDSDVYKNVESDDFVLKDDSGAVDGIAYVIETYGIIYNKALLKKYCEMDGAVIKSADEINNFETLKKVADDIQAKKDDLGVDGAFTSAGFDSFLYNSLSIINWMAIKSRQKEISRVTLALSTFYRTALSKGADMVTVENCIRNIEAYLEIQLIMHDNDFKVEWSVDPSVQQELVPKLALQPIVENALEHGLDVKEEGEKILRLSFFEEAGDVVIRVEDNGMGMEQEQAEKLITYQAKGYGLKNVNDRMCILYGEDYAIRILSKVGQGTRVDMRIPKEVKKDET